MDGLSLKKSWPEQHVHPTSILVRSSLALRRQKMVDGTASFQPESAALQKVTASVHHGDHALVWTEMPVSDAVPAFPIKFCHLKPHGLSLCPLGALLLRLFRVWLSPPQVSCFYSQGSCVWHLRAGASVAWLILYGVAAGVKVLTADSKQTRRKQKVQASGTDTYPVLPGQLHSSVDILLCTSGHQKFIKMMWSIMQYSHWGDVTFWQFCNRLSPNSLIFLN